MTSRSAGYDLFEVVLLWVNRYPSEWWGHRDRIVALVDALLRDPTGVGTWVGAEVGAGWPN